MYARPFIDSPDFAANRGEISGEVPVADLQRLQDMLESSGGILRYAVHGGVDKQGIPYLDLRVAGQCRLRCQRCLEGFDYPVQLDTRLLLRDQAGLDELDSDVASAAEEEFDSILADKHLNVLDLLEEEILLSLPIAPKHALGACQAADGKNLQGDVNHPFAVLAELKRN